MRATQPFLFLFHAANALIALASLLWSLGRRLMPATMAGVLAGAISFLALLGLLGLLARAPTDVAPVRLVAPHADATALPLQPPLPQLSAPKTQITDVRRQDD